MKESERLRKEAEELIDKAHLAEVLGDDNEKAYYANLAESSLNEARRLEQEGE